jgi:hypothetical protein
MSPTTSSTRIAHRYQLPELLHDIRLLDLLELSGTTVQASQLLNLSQPTVSRRYRSLAQDFGLLRETRSLKRCRYGSSTAMRLIRLGYRAHRLAAGVARVGSDLMHHHLLAGCDWLLPTPVRFRSVDEWAELVRQGVLDAALISGLELQAAKEADTSGLRLLELGSLCLALGVKSPLKTQQRQQPPPPPSAVLVPHRGLSPGLHRALLNRGLKLRSIGSSCSTAEQWLMRLRGEPLALPLDAAACANGQWAQELMPLPLAAELCSPLWLLLPRTDGMAAVITRTLEHLQHRPALVHQGAQ